MILFRFVVFLFLFLIFHGSFFLLHFVVVFRARRKHTNRSHCILRYLHIDVQAIVRAVRVAGMNTNEIEIAEEKKSTAQPQQIRRECVAKITFRCVYTTRRSHEKRINETDLAV